MTDKNPRKSSVARSRWILLAALALLAGCAGPSMMAQIPASGINSSNGGSEETIYYDNAGHAHFHA
jgi:hypothetical protein